MPWVPRDHTSAELSELGLAMQSFIREQELCEPGARLLVAVSGGRDSVALVHLLLELGYPVELAHVNYHLRGEESNADEAFVRALAQSLGLTLHVQAQDAQAKADAESLSLQVAARRLRYAFFEQLLDLTEADAFCTAHHRDDVAETVLYNLVRGRDFAVLQGIPVRRERYIRPLLFATREQITRYLTTRGLSWRDDASNASTAYPRNFLRHKVIPPLTELNANLTEQLAERLHLYSLQHHHLTQQIDAKRGTYWVARGNSITIEIDALLRFEGPAFAALFLYYELESQLGFTHAEVRRTRELLGSQTGRYFEAQGWRVNRDRGRLLLHPTDETEATQLPRLHLMPGENRWGPWRIVVSSIKDQAYCQFLLQSLPPPPGVVWLRGEGIAEELYIRKWWPSARIHPVNFDGSKLVSDVLNEMKLSGQERESAFVISTPYEVGLDRVVYVEGYRIARQYALTEDSREVVELRFYLHEG